MSTVFAVVGQGTIENLQEILARYCRCHRSLRQCSKKLRGMLGRPIEDGFIQNFLCHQDFHRRQDLISNSSRPFGIFNTPNR